MVIYANKPEYDAYTNDVDQVLHDQGLTPQVIVHRGHSYHVNDTIDKIPPTAALVFLGNCGSYNQLEAVLAKAPRAHIITTQGIGSLTVNDPLLKALNEHLLRAQELHWSAFWPRVTARLEPNPRFADYLSPDQNAGLIFLKAYRDLTAQERLKEG
jgi:hypothetical protein